MTLLPVCLDMDGSVLSQKTFASRLSDTQSLTSEEEHLRLWADRRGIAAARKAIAITASRHPGPRLTFLGSGDFHHMTALLIEALPIESRPLYVVVIDNHPDWFKDGPRYHCGNWVSQVLRFPWIKGIYLAGQDSRDLTGMRFWFAPFSELCRGRVHLYPYSRKKSCVPLRWPSSVEGVDHIVKRFYGVDLNFKTVQEKGAEFFFDNLAALLSGSNIYLSIDKDCLVAESAMTDWEQGRMPLESLVLGIRRLVARCRIVGADVCGDRANRPLKGWLKRVDAGRLTGVSPSKNAVSINEKTNTVLLDAFLSQSGALL